MDEIAAVIARLTQQFPEVSPAEVAAVTRDVVAELSGRPIRSNVAVLVEHHARERLRELTTTH